MPLSQDEMEAAFGDRSLWRVSLLRQAAAVLDTRGASMTVDEVEDVLARITKHRAKLAAATLRLWPSPLVLSMHGCAT